MNATDLLMATAQATSLDPAGQAQAAAPQPEAAARKTSPLERELNRTSEQCTTLSRLVDRLEGALIALRGRPSQEPPAEVAPPAAPKEMSFLEGTKFINDCNGQVIARAAQIVGELEDLLGCRST